jgi:uncharacterized protein (TIGR00255 family)
LAKVGNEVNLPVSDLVPMLIGSPDLFISPRFDDEDALEKATVSAFSQAIEKLQQMRRVEGQAMAAEVKIHHDNVKRGIEKIGKLALKWPGVALKRIRERLSVLIEKTDISIASGRAEAEAALLVDRADITEEITRLKSHFVQMTTVMESKDVMGRKMEFLIQEMIRETNTIGSKTAMPEISEIIIDMKAELEKMRELAQNIE